MIILGTPSIQLDFGIPNWAVLLIIGLMVLSYHIGKRQGIKGMTEESSEVFEDTELVED